MFVKFDATVSTSAETCRKDTVCCKVTIHFSPYQKGAKFLRLSPYFSAGALANIRQFTILRPEAGSGLSDVKLLFGKSAVTYKAVLGAGIAYKINTHLSLIAQPLLIWNFKPNGSYEHFVSYQVNGQTQLLYSF